MISSESAKRTHESNQQAGYRPALTLTLILTLILTLSLTLTLILTLSLLTGPTSRPAIALYPYSPYQAAQAG